MNPECCHHSPSVIRISHLSLLQTQHCLHNPTQYLSYQLILSQLPSNPTQYKTSLNKLQTSLSHMQTSLSHMQTSLRHMQTSLSHIQTNKQTSLYQLCTGHLET